MHRNYPMKDFDAIDDQHAHDWFARLRAPGCSAEDRAAFERWRADPQHAAAYANLEDLWALTGELAQDDPEIAAAVREARHADTRPWLARRRWSLLATAASLALSCLVLLALQSGPGAQAYVTAVGEQRTLTLEDGSQVVLDTATHVDVQYSRRARSLVLRQGRADFHVRKDARLFVVQAGAAAVTATGTQFQVRLDGAAGEGEVTLLEGRVVVASPQAAGETALSPGERIALEAGGTLGAVQRLSDAERANAEGWTGGQLVVQAWPVAALVAEVNRYGGTPLRLGDAAVAQLTVSGTFDPKSPEALALALEFGWPVRVARGAGEIVLYAKQ